MATPGNTVRLQRVLRCTPDKAYRAFLDPKAMVKWLPPHGFTGEVHHMDARVGGGHRMSFTNFGSGHSHSFGGTYLAQGALCKTPVGRGGIFAGCWPRRGPPPRLVSGPGS
jgi:hypothetical protein